MKFLLDVHIPVALKFFLVWKGFEAIHVKDILNGVHTKDKEISKFADANDMVLITKDNDFKNSFFVHKIPKKIIRITLGNCSNEALLSLTRFWRKILVFSQLYFQLSIYNRYI